jgi:hypothetical protein
MKKNPPIVIHKWSCGTFGEKEKPIVINNIELACPKIKIKIELYIYI